MRRASEKMGRQQPVWGDRDDTSPVHAMAGLGSAYIGKILSVNAADPNDPKYTAIALRTRGNTIGTLTHVSPLYRPVDTAGEDIPVTPATVGSLCLLVVREDVDPATQRPIVDIAIAFGERVKTDECP